MFAVGVSHLAFGQKSDVVFPLSASHPIYARSSKLKLHASPLSCWRPPYLAPPEASSLKKLIQAFSPPTAAPDKPPGSQRSHRAGQLGFLG